MSVRQKHLRAYAVVVMALGIGTFVCSVTRAAQISIRSRARMDQNSRIAHAQLLEKARQGRIDVSETDLGRTQTAPRQRLSLNAHWRFKNYAAGRAGDDLIYDVRPKARNRGDNRQADTIAAEAETVYRNKPG